MPRSDDGWFKTKDQETDLGGGARDPRREMSIRAETKTRVLVIEPDSDDFEIVAGQLRELGDYEIFWAKDRVSGLHQIATGCCDVVLVEQQLGGTKGLDLIRLARELGPTPPLIVLTGNIDDDADRHAAGSGAADQLTKSQITPQLLQRSIRYAVTQHQTLSALEQSEQRFRTTFRVAPEGMALTDTYGRFLDANPAFVEMFGYGWEALSVMTFPEIADPEDTSFAESLFHEGAIEVGTTVKEIKFMAEDGDPRLCLVTSTPVNGHRSGPDGYHIIQLVDVTDLRNARLELQRNRRRQNEFLSAFSHELRNPLAAVIGLAELLRDPGLSLDVATRADLVNTIVESGFDVANLVEDLVTAARHEAGQLEVVAVPVSLAAQVNQALETIGYVAEIPVTGSSSRAVADPSRVRQIMRNLLTNAVRHGGGTIVVELDDFEDMARAVVVDDGPGVRYEMVNVLLDRSADDGRSSVSGIGLSIARDLATLMGGDLRYVRDEGLTRFELLLPTHRG